MIVMHRILLHYKIYGCYKNRVIVQDQKHS